MYQPLKEDLRTALQEPSNTLILVGTGVSIGATRNARCASWRGLIEDGIDFCLQKGLQKPEWAERRRQQLNSQELDELLGAAEMLQRALGGEKGSHYARWLEESVGKLRVSVPDVVKVLSDFEGPLATTNYDGLLEEATRREPVTWRRTVDVERVLRGTKRAILHLHGYWNEPESVILSIRDYERILQAEGAQALQKAIGALRSIVFVGCGGEGLSDPNFGPMLDWVLRVFGDSRFHHYLLLRSKEAADLEKTYPQTGKLRIISYGDDFRDLGPFFREVIKPSPSAVGLVGSEARNMGSSPAPPVRLPVRPVRCIGRDEVIKELTATLLQDKVPPIPVLGPAGIGKSTVTLSALHDEQVATRFGSRRYFVRCDASLDAEALLTQLSLELQMSPGPSLQERLFGELDRAPTLLVLDNLETPWEQDTQAVEELLVRLTALPRLALIVSLRGKARPAGPEWRDPPFDLEPLGQEDSRRVLLAIAGQRFAGDPRLEDFLTALEGVPLAIELLAYVCQGAPDLEVIWNLWEQKRTEILRRNKGSKGKQASPRHESLEASYELSLESPRMTKQALRLLKLLGLLPQGMAHGDLRKLPIAMDSIQAAMTLRQMGLAFDEAGRLRMLAPLREYANRRHRPSASDRDLLVNQYLQLAIQECERMNEIEAGDAVRQLSTEVGNLESMLELGLQRNDPRPAIEAVLKWAKFTIYSGLGTTRPFKRALDASREIKDIQKEASCLFALGRIAARRAHPQDAEGYFHRALILWRRARNPQGQANCIHRLGDIALLRSQLDEAIKLFRESQGLCRQIGNQQGLANCIHSLGRVARCRSQNDEAAAQFRAALELYRQTQDRLGQANCIQGLGEVARHRSQSDEAAKQFHAALELYRQLEARQGQANCIKSLGEVALQRGQPAEAAKQFHSALELYRQLEDRQGQANCIQSLGEVACQRSQVDEAAKQFQAALDLYRKTEGRQGQANCIQSLGDVALQRSQLDEATKQSHSALELYRQTEDRQGQANCINSLGKVALQRSHLDEASRQFQAALELYQQTEDRNGQASCINNLGEIALQRSKFDEAASQFQSALELYQQIDARQGQANCIQNLGEAALQRSQLDEALKQFQTALELYRQTEDPQGQASCVQNLGEVSFRRSQPEEARRQLLEALKQHERLPDLLSIGKIYRSLARMEADAATRKQHIDQAVIAWSQLGNRVLVEELLKEFPGG